VAFDSKKIGKKPAGQHNDEAGMSQMDSKFLPGPAKATGMSGDKVKQKNGSDEVAAGEDGYPETVRVGWPPNEKALKIPFLYLMNVDVDLRKSPGQNQHHSGGQTDNGQLE